MPPTQRHRAGSGGSSSRSHRFPFSGAHYLRGFAIARHFSPAGDARRNVDFRAPGKQACNRRIPRDDARIGTQSHLERPALEAGKQLYLVQHIRFAIKQRPASPHHQFTEHGQPERAPLAVEQGDTQLGLQRLDALGERRLRYVQRLGGAPEMRVLDEGKQVTKAALGDHDE
jgi:hypothetical protein